MKIELSLLQQCEDLIAKGKTGEAIEKIIAEKDKTIYKSELLTLSNRWKKYSNEQLTATLSNIESALENAKINKALLELLSALRKESESGEMRIIKERIPSFVENKKAIPLWRLVLPWVIAAIVTSLWLSTFFFESETEKCNAIYPIVGDWEIELLSKDGTKREGTATITKEGNCCNDFHLTGKITTLDGQPFGFLTKIGGIRDDEIFFIFNNIEKEYGIFRGVVPTESPDAFSLLYFDTVDYLPENTPQGRINFKRITK